MPEQDNNISIVAVFVFVTGCLLFIVEICVNS